MLKMAVSSGWLLLGAVCVLALVSLAGCNSNDNSPNFNGQTFQVAMTTMDSFDPVNITVTPGSQITWTNNDTDPHTVTADLDNPVPGGPNSAFVFPAGLPGGRTWSFIVPNTVPVGTVWFYHCCNHGAAGNGTSLGAGMAGSITIAAP